MPLWLDNHFVFSRKCWILGLFCTKMQCFWKIKILVLTNGTPSLDDWVTCANPGCSINPTVEVETKRLISNVGDDYVGLISAYILVKSFLAHWTICGGDLGRPDNLWVTFGDRVTTFQKHCKCGSTRLGTGVGNSHRSASLRPTTLENQELFVDFSFFYFMFMIRDSWLLPTHVDTTKWMTNIRLWTHKQDHIPHPWGWAMECL